MSRSPRRGRQHPHRGHKMTAAERHRLSARMRGRHQHRRAGTRRHHKGHKLTAAARRKISAREKGRKHPHRGRKGVHHRHASRSHSVHRHRRSTRAGTRRRAGRGPVRQPHSSRGQLYPSRFGHRRRSMHSRFNHHKRVRALRAPFVAGRRHVRAWK